MGGFFQMYIIIPNAGVCPVKGEDGTT